MVNAVMRTAGIRGQTSREIYDLVGARGLLTKNEIAGLLGLSLPTVSKYVSHLKQEGLLAEGARLPSGAHGGRSPVAYRCVPDGRLAVGVDITAEGVVSLMVDLEREVRAIRRTRQPFTNTPQYFDLVADEVRALIQQSGAPTDRILGVGVAMPGLVSRLRQVVTYGPVLDNAGVSAADFSTRLRFPIHLVHDSDAAGLAEFWPDRGFRNAFYVSLSRSVGGSVLIGGEVYLGDGEFAGEIGHVPLHPGGLRCYCGKQGCMDRYCNASVLTGHTNGQLTAFFEGVERGDPDLVEVWDRYTTDLARAVVDIRLMYGATVVLGGDVGAHLGDRLDDVAAKVADLHFLTRSPEDFLVACTHTVEPVATGAALSFVRDFTRELGAS